MDDASCPACEGTGQVVPDAFGDWESWSRYRDRILALEAAEGWPESSSAIATGMIGPAPCPVCRPVDVAAEAKTKTPSDPVPGPRGQTALLF